MARTTQIAKCRLSTGLIPPWNIDVLLIWPYRRQSAARDLMDSDMTSAAANCVEAAQLIYRLFRALDEKDDALVGSLFASQGTWQRQGRLLTGPSEVAAALAERELDRNTIHVISNVQVAAASDGTLICVYYLTAYIGNGGTPMALGAILDCRDEMISTSLGLRIIAKTSRRLL
jgi:SnoaL-like protein